jgi:uncharacterized membrane protein
MLMRFQQYKALLLIVTSVSALLVVSPVIQQLLVARPADYLTELSILGPYHNATYPFNVLVNETYPLYLNVKNRLESSAYYLILVKFRNQTQSSPDSFNHTFSTLPSLWNVTFFVALRQTLELPFNVSFSYKPHESFSNISFSSITLNGYTLDANLPSIAWDSQAKGYLGNLFFELWLFNSTTSAFQYNQRYVSLWLKMEV